MKLVHGAIKEERIKCSSCKDYFTTPLKGQASAVFWVSVCEQTIDNADIHASGFQTDSAPLCFRCSADILFMLKDFLKAKLK